MKDTYKTEHQINRLQYVVKVAGAEPYTSSRWEPLAAHIKTLKGLGLDKFTVEKHTISSVIYTRK